MKANRSDTSGFEDFRRYQNGEMSSRERHLLEKEMLENRLLADAYEGFLLLQNNQIDFANINKELRERLENRTSASRKRTVPLWAYGAAASLIITLGACWLVFVSNPKQETIREISQKPLDKPLTRPTPEAQPSLSNTPEVAVSASKSTPKAESKPRRAKELEPAVAEVETNLNEEVRIAEHSDQVSVPASAAPEGQAFSYSARDPLRSSATNSLSDKPKYKKSNHVVPETASTLRTAPSVAAFKSIYPVKARPLMGWDAYNAYLDEQTRAARRNGEVIVSFKINADGSLTDFTAQGKKPLQPEAIRIISGGPLWVPAQQNDSAVSTAATLRLEFRK
ncbi:energy transducer TonB [Dyadobacter chenhuakuii]|uniref:Energy transducer TonB n=1 Tax=Dyadobacter chenhuakuii TaxID=2909339 RepID=A0A9X1Q8W5_9BACT|nr:energy transducer TonB [Dyadobacter chenhuakuii]MCF2497030.1 energy transducer TonB [Dyadobacter chenhuakuii]